MAHTDQANLQFNNVSPEILEGYTEEIVDRLQAGDHWLMLYPEHKTCFMIVAQTDYVAEGHVFSEGGPWGMISALRKVREDIWSECDYTRIEWRVQEPVIKAIVEKAGYRVEGTRCKAWRSKAGVMVDEYTYAIIRGEKTWV